MHYLELPKQQEFIVCNDSCKWLSRPFFKLEDACILVCRQGEACIEINSEEYQLEPNTHSLLLPGTIIGSTTLSPDFKAFYILFSQELFREITNRLDPSFFRFMEATPTFTSSEERMRPIKHMHDLIEELYNDKDNCFRAQILRNNLQSILLHIYDKTRRFFLEHHPEGVSRQEELFKQFILLVHKHCSAQREVAFYASQLCISPRYLSAIVHHKTGTSAKHIIDKHVILEIKTYLKSTSLSAQDISTRLHFPDQSLLARYFKKHAGMSPLQYRNELQGLPANVEK